MSLTRGEIAGFLRAQVFVGKSESEAKESFIEWLNQQSSSVVTDKEKELILSDLSSYQV